MSDFSEIELAAAVRAVRAQLVQAARDGANDPVRFEVGPIQMDFAVELRREAGASGGVKAWVLSAEAEAKASRATTHRVSFTLTPKDVVRGGPVEVGDDRPAGTSRFNSDN